MSKEMNMRPDGLIWGKWKVDDRFYVLTNQWENFCYLLIGDEKALLLDAGYEWDGDLRAVVEEITDLPVMVVLTHGHLDHAGQIYWWDECWCGEGAEHDYEITVDPEQYASWKSKLGENFVWHILEDGEVIDIGGNEFEVIRVTAHAKSGLMLIDRKRRILFSGDQIDPSQVLLYCNDEITTKEAIENIEISGDGDDTEPEAPGINGHTYVEMGDGLKWATMNIGATKPEEYGDYFAWGETATKESYAWTNYIFAKDPSDYSSGVKKYSEEDSYKTLFPEDDAATSLWKDPWRMPTEGEWAALRDEKLYTWKWETNYNGSGKNGMLVTRKEGTGPCAGNSIFLPAAGRRYESQWLYEGSQGFYWSSSLDTALFAMGVDVLDSGSRWLTADRYAGLNVRPVSD